MADRVIDRDKINNPPTMAHLALVGSEVRAMISTLALAISHLSQGNREAAMSEIDEVSAQLKSFSAEMGEWVYREDGSTDGR